MGGSGTSTINYNLARSENGDGGSVYSVDPSTVEKTFDVLLYKLQRFGAKGILKLSASLRKYDTDLSNLITIDEYQASLEELRIDFTPEEIRGMFRYLESPKREGFMDYALLIRDLTSGMSATRRDIIRSTFDRFDAAQIRSVDLKQLKTLFNPRNHYDVKNGRRHADEVMDDFFACIDLFVGIQRGVSSVNSEQFLEFWEHLSPSVQTDAEFETLLRNCFRYNELPRKNKLEVPSPGSKNAYNSGPIYDSERIHPSDSLRYTIFPGTGRDGDDQSGIFSVFEHLREQLSKRGPKGFILLLKTLKTNDYDHDGKISCKEFIKALHEIRVQLLDKENIVVFKTFDPNNSGFMPISEFMNNFIPELNPRRGALIDELLASLCGSSQKVSYATIKKVFNARGHPDFLSSSKADYEIKDDFYNVLDTFLNLTCGLNDFISHEVLLQFFEIYSFAYTDDNYFENIIRGLFRLHKSFDPRKSVAQSQVVADNQSQKSSPQKHISAPFGTDNQARPQTASQQGSRPQSVAGGSINQDDRPSTASSHRGQNQQMRGSQVMAAMNFAQATPPQANFGKKSGVQNVEIGSPQFENSPQPQGFEYKSERATNPPRDDFRDDVSVLSQSQVSQAPSVNRRFAPSESGRGAAVTFDSARTELVKQ